MRDPKLQNEIDELVKILKSAKEAYYQKNDEENSADLMDDETFDELETKLTKLDPDNDYFKSVGTENKREKDSHFVSKEHTLKMGSQNKVQSADEYIKWSEQKDLENTVMCVSEKADGSSLAITYVKSNEVKMKNLNESYDYFKNYLDKSLNKDKDYKLEQLEKNKSNLINIMNNTKEKDFGLSSRVTRGDGVIGEDITFNAYKFKNLLPSLDLNKLFDDNSGEKIQEIDGNRFKVNDIERVEIRGEVIIKRHDYEVVNKIKPYKNMRNAVAGIMRRQDGENNDMLSVLTYNFILVDNEGHELHFNDDTQFELLKKAGFEITNYFKANSPKEIIKEYDEYKKTKRKNLDYLIDGLVVKINDKDKRNELGITNQRPNGEVAVKFEHQIKMSVIVDTQYYFGKSGVITPVRKIAPVDIDGVTVENASLANKSRMYGMLLKPGTPVMVSRRNDVIPKIEENMDINIQKVYTQVFKLINKNINSLDKEDKEKLNNYMTNNNHEFKLDINNVILMFNKNNYSKKDFIAEIDNLFLKANVYKNNGNSYDGIDFDINIPSLKEEVLEHTFKFISNCPKCGHKLVKDNASYKCINNECSGVKIGKMVKFTEDIDGLGEGIMNQLNDYGIASSVKDFFELKPEDFKNIQNRKELFEKHYKNDLLNIIKDTLDFDFNKGSNTVESIMKKIELIIIPQKDSLGIEVKLEDHSLSNLEMDSLFTIIQKKLTNLKINSKKEININGTYGSNIDLQIDNIDFEENFPKEIKIDYYDGWKGNKIKNTLNSIKRLRKCSDAEFMGRFGFNNMGESRFLTLFQEVSFNELKEIKKVNLNYDESTMKTKEKFIEYVKSQGLEPNIEKTIINIVNIEGMAGKSTSLLVNEFSQRRNEVLELLNYIETTTTPKIDKNSVKYTVSITGSIEKSDLWSDRSSMEKYLKGKGHTVSSPSSKTNYVITDSSPESVRGNSKYEAGKKLEKEKGKKVVISSKEFINILNGVTMDNSIQLA